MTEVIQRSSIAPAEPLELRGNADAHRQPVSERATVASTPAVILLGGDANALSVARDLGRMGVRVYQLCERGTSARFSRYCTPIKLAMNECNEQAWARRHLLGAESDPLRGSIVLACSDSGIQVLVRHREELIRRFTLDHAEPVAHRAMLNKLTTYKLAAAVDVATPRFWEVDHRDEVIRLRPELVFPLMVKPRLSHLFEASFGRKHVVVSNFGDLLSAYDTARDAHLDVLLVEHIPGGDDKLCSYYTYLDDDGSPLFHFTKRMIRRYPAGMGNGCYHITDWIPELVDPSNRLFAHAGLRGLANVEYKLDARDGRYKLIECNARFTASDCLVSASGVSLATFVYNRLTGREQVPPTSFRSGLRLWDPMRDLRALIERRRTGELTLGAWIKSVLHRQTFPFFSWTDPMPAIARGLKPIARLLSKR